MTSFMQLYPDHRGPDSRPLFVLRFRISCPLFCRPLTIQKKEEVRCSDISQQMPVRDDWSYADFGFPMFLFKIYAFVHQSTFICTVTRSLFLHGPIL